MAIEIAGIKSDDDAAIAEIIQKIGAEFGAVGEGFGPSDAEVLNMSKNYLSSDSAVYLVAKIDNKIVGGCGIASFDQQKKICELRKLFLLPEARGFGVGRKLIEQCLDYAKSEGYNECYLDTLSAMKGAIALYEKFQFEHLPEPIAGTIHGACDVWMLKKL